VDQFDQAYPELFESVRIAAEIGDLVTEAFARRGLSRVYDQQGRAQESYEYSKSSLALFEKIGDPLWIASGLNNVGWNAAHLGDHEYAKSCCERAFATYQQHRPDDHSALGYLLDSLGYVANRMGSYGDAIAYYERARAEYVIANNNYFDADALEMLGNTYRALGQLDKARKHWQQAWQIYREHKRSGPGQRVQTLLDETS
jgi:tetratricopeptide (TPR) repeat protein